MELAAAQLVVMVWSKLGEVVELVVVEMGWLLEWGGFDRWAAELVAGWRS